MTTAKDHVILSWSSPIPGPPPWSNLVATIFALLLKLYNLPFLLLLGGAGLAAKHPGFNSVVTVGYLCTFWKLFNTSQAFVSLYIKWWLKLPCLVSLSLNDRTCRQYSFFIPTTHIYEYSSVNIYLMSEWLNLKDCTVFTGIRYNQDNWETPLSWLWLSAHDE